jgi:phage tail sheath protein FI
VVFEPNNEQLWALIRQTISAFLITVWQTGALAGTTPDEAFLVQCDHTTMSPDDLANGRLICIIGLAPVFPAEFVIFRFEQKTASSQQS